MSRNMNSEYAARTNHTNGLWSGDGTCNWFTFYSTAYIFSFFRLILSLTLINIYMGKLQWMACGHYDLMVIITEWKQMIKKIKWMKNIWAKRSDARLSQKRIFHFGRQTIFSVFCLLFSLAPAQHYFILVWNIVRNHSGIRPSMGEH